MNQILPSLLIASLLSSALPSITYAQIRLPRITVGRPRGLPRLPRIPNAPRVTIPTVTIDPEANLRNLGNAASRVLDPALTAGGRVADQTIGAGSRAILTLASNSGRELTTFISNVAAEGGRAAQNETVQFAAMVAVSYFIAGPLVFELAGAELIGGTALVALSMNGLSGLENRHANDVERQITAGVRELNKVGSQLEQALTTICRGLGVPQRSCNINILFQAQYRERILVGFEPQIQAYIAHVNREKAQFEESFQSYQNSVDSRTREILADLRQNPNTALSTHAVDLALIRLAHASQRGIQLAYQAGTNDSANFMAVVRGSGQYNLYRLTSSLLADGGMNRNRDLGLLNSLKNSTGELDPIQIENTADAIDQFNSVQYGARSPANFASITATAAAVFLVPYVYRTYQISHAADAMTEFKRAVGQLPITEAVRYNGIIRQMDNVLFANLRELGVGYYENYPNFFKLATGMISTHKDLGEITVEVARELLAGVNSNELKRELKELSSIRAPR